MRSLQCIHADLIPSRGDPLENAATVLENAATVLEDGKFAFVGSPNDIPAECPRVPGLWDRHTHFSGGTDDLNFVLPHPATSGAFIVRNLHDILMTGTTSVHEVGGYVLEPRFLSRKPTPTGPTSTLPAPR